MNVAHMGPIHYWFSVGNPNHSMEFCRDLLNLTLTRMIPKTLLLYRAMSDHIKVPLNSLNS